MLAATQFSLITYGRYEIGPNTCTSDVAHKLSHCEVVFRYSLFISF